MRQNAKWEGDLSRYMKVLLASLGGPLVMSLWPPLGFYRHWRALLASISAVLAVFGAWDVLATHRRHWHFEPSGVWKPRLINLPVEEALFFPVITFCCLFTWEAIKYIKRHL
jgi:lycopene cyclase domain-containing protein